MKPSKELRISESTGRFLDILRRFRNMYSDVYSALELTYSDEDCAGIINERFYAEYKALERRLEALAMESINERLGQSDPSEI